MSVIMSRHNLGSGCGDPPPGPGPAPAKMRNPATPTTSLEQSREKNETLKNCCRIFVELMFTQVESFIKKSKN